MEGLFLLIAFLLVFEIFFFGNFITKGKPIPLSKAGKVLVALAGLAGVIGMFLILRKNMIPTRNNQVYLPTFNLAFPDAAVMLVLLGGIVENLALLVVGLVRRGENNYGVSEMAEVSAVTDQKVLGEIAKTHKQLLVRLAAVVKLTDQKLLSEIAKTDGESTIRAAAVGMLTSRTILAEIGEADKDKNVRETVRKRVADLEAGK